MECLIGQVQVFAFNFAPRGWVPCHGQLLPISENSALFALVGTTYGGDGRSTFAVPKLADLAPGLGYYIASQGSFPARA